MSKQSMCQWVLGSKMVAKRVKGFDYDTVGV